MDDQIMAEDITRRLKDEATEEAVLDAIMANCLSGSRPTRSDFLARAMRSPDFLARAMRSPKNAYLVRTMK